MSIWVQVLVFLVALVAMTFPFWLGLINITIEALRDRKQSNCFHLWRRLDGDYTKSETVYRYRCSKCKLEKKLCENQAKRFEEDFMSDWE